ncbi:MAG: 4Fe-4S dicluster domain-containing protein [Candidatus Geothermarchaeales archaeon]
MPLDVDAVEAEALDQTLVRKLLRHLGGENILACFQCSVCVAACPVRVLEPRFNPRKLTKMVFLGMSDQLFKMSSLWLCSTCYSCQERCPQVVNPLEVMNAVKNMAFERGFTPQAAKKIAETVRSHGSIYPMDEYFNEKRVKRGLPKLKSKPDDVLKTLGDWK